MGKAVTQRETTATTGLTDFSTETDDVFIDENSGFDGGGTITVDMESSCQNLTSESGDIYTITGNEYNFYVYGSLTLESGLTFDEVYVYLLATTTGKTITSNGGTISYLQIEGVGGGWTLLDNLIVTTTFWQQNGIFDANDYNVTANDFNFYADTGITPTVTMGSGIWEITGNDDTSSNSIAWNIGEFNDEYVTFTPETSTIKFTDESEFQKTFVGKIGLVNTYYNVWVSGSGSGPVYFYDENVFNNLKIDAGRSVIFDDGFVHTINTLDAIGSDGNLITLRGPEPDSYWMITAPSGIISCDYLSIHDSIVTGDVLFYAGEHSVDGGNNIGNGDNPGWIFTAPP